MTLPLLNRNLIKKDRLPEKVLQFGEGNFLRAFANWCIDTMNHKGLLNAGVVVVQPLPNGLIPILNEQEGLYTLYLNGIKNGEAVSEYQVVSCITRGINPYEAYSEYLKTAENSEMEFVISNTTEAGIAFKGEMPAENETPESFPGKLTAWLHHRFLHFNGDNKKGMTIIPCELINHNGKALKECILQYATLWKLGNGFESWINDACTFCNTLVDRIVPGYPASKAEALCNDLGYQDNLLVEGEQFHLWVIEAPDVVKERFPADNAGLNVIFTNDQAPYRSRKVRILNGAHTTMVPIGLLYGVSTVKEVMDDAFLLKFIKDTVDEEIIPTLSLDKEELSVFAADVLDRFRNPYIKHLLLSISLNSHSKYNTRIFPTVSQYLKQEGTLPKRLVLALAALIQLFRDKEGTFTNDLKDNNEVLELYKTFSINTSLEQVVTKVFALESIWGNNLNQTEGLKALTIKFLQLIDQKGIKKVIEEDL